MALTGEELVDAIQSRVGRVGDTELIDDTFCTRRLNEAGRKIAKTVPGHHNLTFKNTTSLDVTQTLKWSMADITSGLSDVTTSLTVCHVFDVWFLFGLETTYLRFSQTDEFDRAYPDPSHPDVQINNPFYWTRRGNDIEIMPLSSCGYCDNAGIGDATEPGWRFDIGVYPIDFTTNTASKSDISGADEGLILYGKWKAWEAIGGEEGRREASIARRQWTNPNPLAGEDFGWLEKFKHDSEELQQWEGDLYNDFVE